MRSTNPEACSCSTVAACPRRSGIRNECCDRFHACVLLCVDTLVLVLLHFLHCFFPNPFRHLHQRRHKESRDGGEHHPEEELLISDRILDSQPLNIPGTIMPRAMKPVQIA